ncbi:2-phosphosulfolactate phosphatase [Virgibacillus xinjiangensis]|uniref:Probable 2-phosphosulfolactate phosphatase n=1 Tax=Virgibacillus xinjiangensis TaxID=393090 RepID=A0ABV7CVU5_9BACI
MQISIYQGSGPQAAADAVIVIDVIRAFTVAHYAFLQGAERIYLAQTIEQAFKIKEGNPDYLLAGEVHGEAIEGFDLENSPDQVARAHLYGKSLVQKTTNGVRAALNSLNSKHVFVTGFTNAEMTAKFIRRGMGEGLETIQIIASHPTGDDDLACAEYIRSLIKDDTSITKNQVRERIIRSEAAEKFLADSTIFRPEDITRCLKELDTDFVMKINQSGKIPMIERVHL